MWSVVVHFEPCPEGRDLGEHCQALRVRSGGYLQDHGHIEWPPLSLEARVHCTTTELIQLCRKNLYRKFSILRIEFDDLSVSDEVGGEG